MRFGHESSNLILCCLIQLHVTGFSFHVNKFKIVIDEELKVRYGINFRNNLVLILTRLILRKRIKGSELNGPNLLLELRYFSCYHQTFQLDGKNLLWQKRPTKELEGLEHSNFFTIHKSAELFHQT